MPVFTLLGLGIFFLGMAVGFGLSTGEDEEPVTVTVAEQGQNPGEANSRQPEPPGRAIVASVADGDSIRLEDGRRVRLLQIDAPEIGEGECYSRKAASVLKTILPVGTSVRLRADPTLDQRDRFGRLLRYVFKGKTNINVALVRRGAASAYFVNEDRGRYAARLLGETQGARAESRGLWQACRGTELNPDRALDAIPRLAPPPPTPATPPPPPSAGDQSCDPSYPTVCLNPSVSDYDCAERGGNGPEYVYEENFRVRPPDPFELDGNDNDGLGCES